MYMYMHEYMCIYKYRVMERNFSVIVFIGGADGNMLSAMRAG